MTRSHWVAVLAEVEGLRWALKNSRMAWTAGSASRASRVTRGDGLILYVARGAFRNPTRDRSQLGALAEVASAVRIFRRPVAIAGREFVCGCDLDIEASLPERAGVPVAGLVGELSFVRRKEVWGQYFRSGLMSVSEEDFGVMARAIRRSAVDLRQAEGTVAGLVP